MNQKWKCYSIRYNNKTLAVFRIPSICILFPRLEYRILHSGGSLEQDPGAGGLGLNLSSAASCVPLGRLLTSSVLYSPYLKMGVILGL